MIAARAVRRGSPNVCRRLNSTGQPSTWPPPQKLGFRKTYGRALGKVLLMTYGTYQGLQYLWWNLDLDEVRKEKQAVIVRLEDEVERVSGVSDLPRLKLEERKW